MLEECTRNNLCVDCNNDKCSSKGNLRADCPKYHCDRGELGFEHCESCAFMKQYALSQREYYKQVQQDKESK